MTAEEIIKEEIDQLNQEETKVMQSLDRINIRRQGMFDLLAKVSSNGTPSGFDESCIPSTPKSKADFIRGVIRAMRGMNYTAADVFAKVDEYIPGKFEKCQMGGVQNVLKSMLNKNLIAIVEKGIKGKSVNVYANVHWDK